MVFLKKNEGVIFWKTRFNEIKFWKTIDVNFVNVKHMYDNHQIIDINHLFQQKFIMQVYAHSLIIFITLLKMSVICYCVWT